MVSKKDVTRWTLVDTLQCVTRARVTGAAVARAGLWVRNVGIQGMRAGEEANTRFARGARDRTCPRGHCIQACAV